MSRDEDMEIVGNVARVNDASRDFVQGILYDSLSPAEQVAFALRLARLAEAIKTRALPEDQPMVIEGSTADDDAQR